MKLTKKAERVLCTRQHPIKILSYTTGNFWLLLIPLSRSLVAMKFDIASWLKGAWLDILIVSAIFLFAAIRWFFTIFDIDDEGITKRTGFVITMTDKIFFSQITSLCVGQGLFNRPLRSCVVYIDTNSGGSSRSDIKLLMRKKDATHLFDIVNSHSPTTVRYTFSPRRLHLVIFSLVFSSSLTGVILFATVMYQASKIVGREFEERLLITFNELTKTLAYRLPPVMAAIGFVILGGWLISFTCNLLRYWSFTVTRRGERMVIKSGFMTKYANVINTDKINFTDIRQNLPMKIFRVSSVHIHCSGYGKGRTKLAVLLPITTRYEVFDSLHMLMPSQPSVKIDIRPKLRNIMRFLWPPIILAVSEPIIVIIAYRIFPNWRDMIFWIGLIFIVPAAWFLIVKLFAFFNTGVGENDNCIILSYCSFFEFHTVIVPKSHICKITISRSFFQRFGKSCNLNFFTYSESTRCHRTKNLPLFAVEKFLKEYTGIKLEGIQANDPPGKK